MKVLEFLGHAADVTAIPIALIGFGITFYQLRKTRKAAQAAEDGASRAVNSVSRHTLIALIPDLRRAEGDLEQAIGKQSKDLVVFMLQSWQTQAGQARALLEMNGHQKEPILISIQESIAEASTVRRELLENPGADLVLATHDVRVLVAQVAGELNSIGATQATKVGGGTHARG